MWILGLDLCPIKRRMIKCRTSVNFPNVSSRFLWNQLTFFFPHMRHGHPRFHFRQQPDMICKRRHFRIWSAKTYLGPVWHPVQKKTDGIATEFQRRQDLRNQLISPATSDGKHFCMLLTTNIWRNISRNSLSFWFAFWQKAISNIWTALVIWVCWPTKTCDKMDATNPT